MGCRLLELMSVSEAQHARNQHCFSPDNGQILDVIDITYTLSSYKCMDTYLYISIKSEFVLTSIKEL